MIEMFWSIKLKLTAMLNEVKWSIFIRKHDVKSLKKSFSMVLEIIIIHSILIASDIVKFFNFMKEMITQKLIFIPLSIMFLLFGVYLSFINGQADKELFNEKVFPKLYYDTGIEIRDSQNRFAGTVAGPQSTVTNPSLFIEKTPSLFWSLLKEKYDPKLDFDSNATTFFEALSENITYYNGIDISSPFSESRRLVHHFITEQSLALKPKLTLTQQLINIFLKKHPFDTPSNNIARLKLAKTFFHSLKANDGANFKSWLLLEKKFFITDGKGYGFKDCAEIFFGKSLDELSNAQEAVLVAMYAKPFHLNQSLQEQKKAWENIKSDAIEIVDNSDIINNHYNLVSNIKKMHFPKIPYFSDSLMEVVGEITSKNREQFSSLPTRSNALLQSSKAVVRQELDKLFKVYSISPKSQLVTKVSINFELNKIFYFNHYLKEQVEALNLSNMWVSVVNEEGKMIRLYQKNTIYQRPPQIGNLGKIFSALLFADRGDKYYSQYCNKKATSEIPMEEGLKKCSSNAWVDARRVFSSNKMLPLYDGFIKYKEQDRRGENTYYKPIHINKIEALYQNLDLVSLENNEPRVDLGAGKLGMNPLDVQTALHKITQLLYHPNHTFYGLKLVKSLEYHDINKSVIDPISKFFSFDSPEQVTPTFKKFFTKEKRITLQTIFKTPIYKSYGSLQWLRNYINIKFVFAQESHKNGTHWLVGVFKKANKYYSFTIFIEDKTLNTKQIKEKIKSILEATIKSINNEREMKFNYMKQVFRD